MRIAMTLLTVALALSGCGKKKDSDGTGSGSAGSSQAMGSDQGSGRATGSGSAVVASGSGSGSGSATAPGTGDGQTFSHKGGNCPSSVFGSTTKAEIKDGKILLVVTSEDKDAIAAIQKRAELLLKEKTDGGPSGSTHDQKGTHGGGIGRCPVFLGEGGTATTKNEAKGVTITITPKDKAETVKAEIDTRITKMAEWVKDNVKAGDKGTEGGVGGGSGGDGMNHSGQGDGKGMERKAAGSGSDAPKGDGKGGGKGTGGGSGAGTGGGGSGSGSAK